MNDDMTWDAWVRSKRAEGFRLTGRWVDGEPELIRIH